ncbi:hypothetical protein [uncultured Salinisphaera sp.]|uniref:hypothetical protein n=1 Tax=uncultured Salinisphaera sp. TaxID=359372 RepID=UPI0032B1498F
MSQSSSAQPRAMDRLSREQTYRRDFRVIYMTALTTCLLCMPLVRLARMGRSMRGPKKPSMLKHARTEANIIASYALMGF